MSKGLRKNAKNLCEQQYHPLTQTRPTLPPQPGFSLPATIWTQFAVARVARPVAHASRMAQAPSRYSHVHGRPLVDPEPRAASYRCGELLPGFTAHRRKAPSEFARRNSSTAFPGAGCAPPVRCSFCDSTAARPQVTPMLLNLLNPPVSA